MITGDVRHHELDPLRDGRWADFVHRCDAASVFHTTAWVASLERTYGHQPLVITSSAPDEPLRDGLLCCRVTSWLTGCRLVSLPFSDHCDPLGATPQSRASLLAAAQRLAADEGRTAEIRPATRIDAPDGYRRSAQYAWHVVDLRPSIDEIRARVHRNHVARAARRAERRGVRIDVGRGGEFLDAFVGLHKMTRERHGMPTQPRRWFDNLADTFGDRLRIHLARIDDAPVAALLSLVHKNTATYKYGGSDIRHKRHGATPALFWRLLHDAKAAGLDDLDLGRSDLDASGLIAFKNHLGARREQVAYYRSASRGLSPAWAPSLAPLAIRAASTLVPKAVRVRAGGALYKHFA